MNIQKSQVTITTTGDDGSATGSGTVPAQFRGKLMAIYLAYSAGQAATTDVTLSHSPFTVLTVSNTATAGQYFPRVNVDDEAGAAIASLYDYFYIEGQITVTIAQADNNETVTITAIVVDES